MPLLRPEIDKVLKSAGIGSFDETSLSKRMAEHGLGLGDTIGRLSDITENADSDAVRLRAIDTALKMHGVLKETGNVIVPVTIIINDPQSTFKVNPILIPRTPVTAEAA